MPWLYCETDGRRHEAYAVADSDALRRDGESELIVSGTLASGPWRCDSCNTPLNQGDRAVFHAIFPGHITKSMVEYDFSYEREYFALEGDLTVTNYGASWPCGSAAELLERNRFVRHHRLREHPSA